MTEPTFTDKDIYPWNRMPKIETKNLGGKPIIEMSDTSHLIFMVIEDATVMTDYPINFMASIIYNSKKKTIELRGRMRLDESGIKQPFSTKKPIKYTQQSFTKMKDQIKKLITSMQKSFPNYSSNGELLELEFAIDEDMDSIMNKINDSNRFNIGIASKKP